jgi:uncharacterized protein (TIGR02099 family)
MSIRHAQALAGGYPLSRINGAIRNLSERPALTIEGQGSGALADALRYVADTPLAERFGPLLNRISADGPSELQLALDVPLQGPQQTGVRAELKLSGNRLRFGAATPTLTDARARIQFTQNSFTIADASAQSLGGALRVSGGTREDGSMQVDARGVASADALQRSSELGAVSRLAAALGGQAAYRLGITMSSLGGVPEFNLESDLAGLAINLPAPMHKAADTSLPLRAQLSAQDELTFRLGDLVQARYLHEAPTGSAPGPLRGGIGVLDSAPLPARGVAANVKLARLDVDAWRDWAARLQAPTGAASSATQAAGEGDASAAYLPREVALRADEVVFGARRLTQVQAKLAHAADKGMWHAEVQAEELAGLIELQPGSAASDPGSVRARLTRLALPLGDNAAEAAPSGTAEAPPQRVPALDIVIDELALKQRLLGRVEIQGANQSGAGGVDEWRLQRLSMNTPQAQLSAEGQWSPSRRRMVMDFKLQLADSGSFLQRMLDAEPVLRGGKGSLQGQVSWSGSPLALDLLSMSGQMRLALDQGQFLRADPGAARLLSVLSLQSLARRLTLDFRDLFEAGFAFDHILGDVTIRDGVARSDNLRMLGSQAAVLMEGSADIGRETQDLHVVVVPQIDAGTASLAYAVINPAVGLGTFLAQMFLRKPLMQAATREFHVSGGWSDPKVEPVERAFDKPLPHIAQPEAAASEPAPAPTPAASASAPPANP